MMKKTKKIASSKKKSTKKSTKKTAAKKRTTKKSTTKKKITKKSATKKKATAKKKVVKKKPATKKKTTTKKSTTKKKTISKKKSSTSKKKSSSKKNSTAKKKATKKKATTKKKAATKKKATTKKKSSAKKKSTSKKKTTKKITTKKKTTKKKTTAKKKTSTKKKPAKKSSTKKKPVKKNTTAKKKSSAKKKTSTKTKTPKKKIENTEKKKKKRKEFKHTALKGKKTILVILDGFGIRNKAPDNAVTTAKMEFYNQIIKKYPMTALCAHGPCVGLPEGQMGTSEVCHMNMGAGRIIEQDLVKINNEIKKGTFYQNKEILKGIRKAKKEGKRVHLIGLCSDGGVHSHINHLFALLEIARREGLKGNQVLIHAITDGRDTEPKIAKKYIRAIIEKTKELGVGKIATIIGRFYAMDRDNRWDRAQKAYDAIVYGLGLRFDNPISALEMAYTRGDGDEFIKPSIIKMEEFPRGYVKDGDTIIFFNFRSDRARQLTRALVDPEFEKFPTTRMNLNFITFNEYQKNLSPYVSVAFKPEKIKNSLAEWLSKKNKTQFHTAETEKYAHVTYFFNCGKEEPHPGEEWKIIPSPHVHTYDLQPQMSAFQVSNEVVKSMEREYDFILVNFANPDMVGHTGNLYATRKALETVDKCLKKIKEKADEKEYLMIITADHGNCEEMSGVHKTSHTLNKVPFIILDKNYEIRTVKEPRISDIAPTVLSIMKLEKPIEMKGRVLAKEKKNR